MFFVRIWIHGIGVLTNEESSLVRRPTISKGEEWKAEAFRYIKQMKRTLGKALALHSGDYKRKKATQEGSPTKEPKITERRFQVYVN